MQGSTHRSRVMEVTERSGPVAEPDEIAAADAEPLSRVARVRPDHRQPAARVDHQTPPLVIDVGIRGYAGGDDGPGEPLDRDALRSVEAGGREEIGRAACREKA